MLQHYLKIAVRNLLKHKVQTAVSLMGLAIGLSFFLFGLHWYRFETGYDSFYPKSDRTYIVREDGEDKQTWTPYVVQSFFEQFCPEVERSTVSFTSGSMNYATDGICMKQPDFCYVDSNFVHIFPQQIRYGRSVEGELEAIISESLARKYWKNPQEAVGQTLTQQSAYERIHLQSAQVITVVGVMADMPANSNFLYEGYVQQTPPKQGVYDKKAWRMAASEIHLTLTEQGRPEEVVRKLNDFVRTHVYEKEDVGFVLTSLSEKHFFFADKGSFSYSAILLFALASLMLLCCVMFNYLNLSMNRYYARVREMKLRKVLGAAFSGLMVQLMVEVMVGWLAASLLGGMLTELFIPAFRHLFLIPMADSRHIWTEYLGVATLVLLFMELVSGLLMGHFIRTATGRALTVKPLTARYARVRRFSLVTQLAVCLLFISMTVAFFRQLHFMRHSDYGFDTDHIVELYAEPIDDKTSTLLDELNRLPMVHCHTQVQHHPMVRKQPGILMANVEWEGQTPDEKSGISFLQMAVTQDADSVFRFRLKEGRFFSEEDWATDDSMTKNAYGETLLNKVLLSEKAVEVMRLEHPVGSIIRIPMHTYRRGELQTYYYDYEVIGVIRELHVQGMKESTIPTILSQSSYLPSWNYWRVLPGTERQALRAFHDVAARCGWDFHQGRNRPPVLLSDNVEEINKSETALYRLFVCQTVACLLISLFGLYSISFTMLEQRRREVAIRKVMGASSAEVMRLFLSEYLLLLLLAALIAFPLAYVAISRWLQGYASRVEVGSGMFLLLLAVTALMVMLTVLHQVSRAARRHPARNLN
ncbi:MAG: ABC transporter permease [Bacteroides sp.]|nr:ABC transporter permease [Bacteroides sp.]